MTRKQDSAGVRRWSEEIRKALSEDRDLLKTIVEETLQQVLEGEMEEALQAGKSERTETRLGYRAGYYQRTLVTRVGKVELRGLCCKYGMQVQYTPKSLLKKATSAGTPGLRRMHWSLRNMRITSIPLSVA